MNANRTWTRLLAVALMPAALCFAGLGSAGCERRERVIEIRTPGGDVTVDRVERGDGADRIEVETNER